ncbi:AAEL014276-PA [Aedes aegypti]|uniref:AAEL014276-PA n=1 Tax=Aedes aegypti TaxID=7159 RepID=Q16GT0_AEDAE|nr:AAEL014276-PA [Aedes aegypti]
MSKPRFPGRQSLLKVNRNAQLQTVVTRQMSLLRPPTMPTTPKHIDPSLPLRGRPPKRLKMEQLSVGLRHQQGSSFIMKLFDRSVDLAQFDGESSLYPVCRAWMRNQPRARQNPYDPKPSDPASPPRGAESSRHSMPDIVERFNRKEVLEIPDMPKPSETELEPFRFERHFAEGEDNEPDLDGVEGSADRKEILLQHHKARWTKMRRSWQGHRQNYLRKYQLSYDLLDAIMMKQV